MKVVLSNKIFIEYDKELHKKLKKELTYKVPSKMFGEPPETITTLSRIGKKALCIPIGRTDLIPKDAVIIDKRIKNSVDFPKFKFTLRDRQAEVYDDIKDNCLINANTSWGKTFTGIAIATKLGCKTLVIVHTAALRDQWVKEVRKTLGIEPGVIGGGVYNIDSPIVISNIQTLRTRAKELREVFGTVIVDEVHHTPAKVFQVTLNTLSARYKIGLSATLERKDFLHIVLPDYFGSKVYTPPEENQMVPSVLAIRPGIDFSSNMMIPWATKVNELVAKPEYKKIITDLAQGYADKGHKVLVVGDRTEFLDRCHNVHDKTSILVTGNTKNREELHNEMGKSKTINTLYGSISIYKEGISLNWLSVIILACPINNEPLLKQLIGRITRLLDGKLDPIIIDIILEGSTAKRQAQSRLSTYMMRGYVIKTVDLT
jgi:superfamily II DNA or RNA helicase